MASVVLRARVLFVFFLATQTILWSYSRYANGFVSRHTSYSYSSGLRSRTGTGAIGGTIGGLLLKRSNTDATLNLDTTIGTTNDSSVDEAGESDGEEGECAPLTVPASDQCTHVLTHCPTSQTVLSIPYLQSYFCSPLPTRPIIFLTLLTWLLFLFTTLGISSSDFFCPNLSTLSSLLRLDENLAGVTFLAFGNGSPDLFGTYTAMRAGAGSWQPFRVERGKFWRDTGFLAGAVGALVGILWDGRVERWEATGLVGIYGVYVGVVVVGSWWERRVERRMRMRVYEPPEEVQVFEPYRDEPIPNTPSDYLTIPPFQSRERSHSSPASPHSHSLGLGLRLDIGAGGTDGGAYPLTNQSQSLFLSRSRSGSSSRSISPSLTPTPTSPTLVSHQFNHLTFPSHHHGRSPCHQQGHTGQKEHMGHHHRSASTQQMPSFSLVGAIEFRDVVASLREQSATSGATATSGSGSGFATTGNIEFESPGPFVGGHYHSYRLNSFGSGSGSGRGNRDSHISNGSHISGGRKSPLLSRRNTGSVKGFDRSHSRGSVSGTGGAGGAGGGGSRNGSRNGSARGSVYSDIVPLRERSPLSKSIELEEAGAASGPSGSGSGFATTTSGGGAGLAGVGEGEGSGYNEVLVPRVPRIATTPASPDPSEVSFVDGDGDENGDEDEVLGLFSPTDIATGGNGRSLSRWGWRNGRENGRKERREWKVGVKVEEVRRVAGEVGHVLFPTLYGLFGSGSVSSLETESLTQSEGESGSGSGTGNRKEVESRGGKGGGNGKAKKRKSWLGVVFSILAAPAVLALTLTLPVCVTPRVCEKEDCVGAGSGSIGNRVEGDLGEVERRVGAGVPEGRLIEIEVEGGREGTGEEERQDDVDVERGRPTIAGVERTRGQGEMGEGVSEGIHREAEGEQEQEGERGDGEGEIQLELEMGDEVGFNKWLMAAQLVLGPLFCVFVLFSGSGSGSDSDVAGVSNGFINAFVTSGTGNGYGLWFWVIFGITGLLGLGMALMVIKFADKGDNVVGQIARTFMGFFVAVVWIMVIADEVVNVLKTFGFIFGLSDAIIGLTIFAVGNSLADFVANVSVAAFAPIMGFSACFGGPMLNILLGVGVSGLVVTSGGSGSGNGGSGVGKPYELDFSSTLTVSSVGLLVLLGATLVVVPMSGYELTRRWGVVLVCSYVVIMAVNVVVEARTGRG
ncbi:sodium calcium exchanger [Pyrrhoderma noxium]|uniref:Sodium calcium exchanger n=1 Tax=Pyrrhoderma noxium TaxID=2282107 RepID=A0A286UAR8_9AGAM|nr:sodium calcium exchanger [Pyrrhoderma noxium]